MKYCNMNNIKFVNVYFVISYLKLLCYSVVKELNCNFKIHPGKKPITFDKQNENRQMTTQTILNYPKFD